MDATMLESLLLGRSLKGDSQCLDALSPRYSYGPLYILACLSSRRCLVKLRNARRLV